MKILMRNIGMTLHVIHKLRAEGVDNVQVNMDWQHLLMNGENLAEYAAMLAAEGLLGHQHANSGWGTFDDDNMVGATAFMETRRARARAAPGEVRHQRRAPRPRPLPVHRGPGRGGAAVGRAVALHRLRRASASTTRRCARRSSARTRSPRTSSSTPRWGRPRRSHDAPRRPRRRHDVGQGHRDRRGRRGRRTSPSAATRCRRRSPGWSEQDPEDWWTAAARGARRVRGRPRARHRAVGPDARPRRARRRRPPAAPGDPLERRAHAAAVRRDRGARRARAADRADRQPRADRLHRAEAPVAARARARGLRADRARSCCPRTTCACGCAASTRSTSPTRRGRCCSTSRSGAGATRCSRRSRSTRAWLPRVLESPEVAGETHGGVPVAAGAGDQAAGALGVGVVAEGGPASVVLGTSGVVFAALDHYAADPEGARARLLPRGPGRWHVMGVMLSAAGSLRWLRDAHRRRRRVRRAARRGRALGAGRRGPALRRRTSRASARRTPDPDARGAFLGLGLRHDRGALDARGARGRRLRPARRARPRRRDGRRARRAGASPAAAGAATLWLEIVASVLELPLERHARRRGRGVRRGAARRRGRGRVERRARGGRRRACRSTRTIEPRPDWVERYAELQPAFRRMYPALRAVRGD